MHEGSCYRRSTLPTWGRWLAHMMLCLTSAPSSFAQGGPPMLTDDPGTPGSGVWTTTGENMENFGVPPDVYVDNALTPSLQKFTSDGAFVASIGQDQRLAGFIAIDAVKNWRFDPALKDGKPVAVYISVEVDFRLY